jgi:hypothetical protein
MHLPTVDTPNDSKSISNSEVVVPLADVTESRYVVSWSVIYGSSTLAIEKETRTEKSVKLLKGIRRHPEVLLK